MIGFIFAGLIAAFLAVEVISIRQSKCLHLKCEVDKTLVEPGEVNTLCFRIKSSSGLPLFFVSTAIYFEDNITVCEDEDFFRRRVTKSFFGTRVNQYINFVPRGQYTGSVKFCVSKRGIHDIGRMYVETGDFFGLRTMIESIDIDTRVICTAKLADDDSAISALGSYLGDISVRRFIFEDPNLLIGYREYTGHEPMKKISWLQTAKTGELMVKVNDYTVDINVAVVVNMEHDRSSEMEHCLELARTACEYLEQEKIPYAFYSNGDLGSLTEGMGRKHINTILRSIGAARPAGYSPFSKLVDKCIRTNHSNRSYIVVTPTPDDNDKALLALLQSHSDTELCVLYGGKEGQ